MKDILMEIGFSDKEAEIYLCLVKFGSITATQISKETKLNRITCYDVLQKLIEKGAVGYTIINKIKYFEPADPDSLLSDLEEKQDKLRSIIPKLNELKKISIEKPSIEIFEGLKGLKSILDLIIKEKKESWFIAHPNFIETLRFSFPHFVNKKRKLKMHSKLITLDCKKMKEYNAPHKYLDVKFIKEQLPTTKIIFGNKVALLTLEKDNMIAVLIENKDIVETEKKLFDMMWKK